MRYVNTIKRIERSTHSYIRTVIVPIVHLGIQSKELKDETVIQHFDSSISWNTIKRIESLQRTNSRLYYFTERIQSKELKDSLFHVWAITEYEDEYNQKN